MKFIVLALIINNPDPHTGQKLSQHDKLASVLAQAQLTEQPGYDAYQIGERHGAPFLRSSPTVLLSAVALPAEGDEERWAQWPAEEMCPTETNRDRLAAALRRRCRSEKAEPPSTGQVERVVASGCRQFDDELRGPYCSSRFLAQWAAKSGLGRTALRQRAVVALRYRDG